MTLMKLRPEVVRLRRIARAHAAGEVDEAEYRRARREVIDNFSPPPPDGELTRPRWSEAPTLRKDEQAAEMVEAPTAAAGRQRRWLWLGALGLVLLGCYLALRQGLDV
ncbi:MAG: hypothetical protein ACODAC_11270 [Pseudomonadota bacterium]